MQPAGDGVAAGEGVLAKQHMKHRLAIAHADLPIAVRHGDLVKISQQRQRRLVELRKGFHVSDDQDNLTAMAEERKNAVVLLSGGLDSATALAIARAEGFACFCLSFRYGQRHEFELEAAKRVATSVGAAQHVIAQIDL